MHDDDDFPTTAFVAEVVNYLEERFKVLPNGNVSLFALATIEAAAWIAAKEIKFHTDVHKLDRLEGMQRVSRYKGVFDVRIGYEMSNSK